MNYIIGLCAAVFALLYLYVSRSIRVPEFGGPVNGRAFPELLGIVMLVAAAGLVIETVIKARKTTSAGAIAQASGGESNIKVIIGITAATFVYFLVFVNFGYVVSSTLYLLAMTSYFHRGKHIANVIVSITFSIVTYYGMTKYLGMYLPPGRLF